MSWAFTSQQLSSDEKNQKKKKATDPPSQPFYFNPMEQMEQPKYHQPSAGQLGSLQPKPQQQQQQMPSAQMPMPQRNAAKAKPTSTATKRPTSSASQRSSRTSSRPASSSMFGSAQPQQQQYQPPPPPPPPPQQMQHNNALLDELLSAKQGSPQQQYQSPKQPPQPPKAMQHSNVLDQLHALHSPQQPHPGYAQSPLLPGAPPPPAAAQPMNIQIGSAQPRQRRQYSSSGDDDDDMLASVPSNNKVQRENSLASSLADAIGGGAYTTTTATENLFSDGALHSPAVINHQPGVFGVNYNMRLGAGGFGVVYKGFDNIRGEHVAVKEAKIGNDRTLQAELRGEFELLTTLDHPNIVKVRHFNVENGVAQIFMEWMSSGSVQGILRENGFRMHEAAIRRYAAESLKGLHYLHGREMLHRDVKPANMLVAGSGAVKLSDFGTSKVQESTSTTQHVVGTCAYMAPETIRGKYSPGSDVWAWACSVVEMATGQPPWSHLPREQRGNIQLMFHIGSSQPPDHAPAVPDHLSGALREMLTKCFDFDASKRPSCAELLGMGYFTTQRLPDDAESIDDYQQRSSFNPTSTNFLSSSEGSGPSNAGGGGASTLQTGSTFDVHGNTMMLHTTDSTFQANMQGPTSSGYTGKYSDMTNSNTVSIDSVHSSAGSMAQVNNMYDTAAGYYGDGQGALGPKIATRMTNWAPNPVEVDTSSRTMMRNTNRRSSNSPIMDRRSVRRSPVRTSQQRNPPVVERTAAMQSAMPAVPPQPLQQQYGGGAVEHTGMMQSRMSQPPPPHQVQQQYVVPHTTQMQQQAAQNIPATHQMQSAQAPARTSWFGGFSGAKKSKK